MRFIINSKEEAASGHKYLDPLTKCSERPWSD